MSERLLLTLVEASLRAFLLAALVGALLLLLRVPRGAPRHSAWLVVAVGMLTMPLLQRLAVSSARELCCRAAGTPGRRQLERL